MSEKRCPVMTTSAGAPVADNQNALTAGERGPVLLQDYQLIEKLAHQNRERIPERVVHAKGWGAYGTFRVTHDISSYTTASCLQPGAECEVITRFSTVAGELGAADAERDVRGFAVKFYTEEGNWDLVGNNTPVFFIRDPYKFPDFIRTQKRHPKTNLRSPTAMWDFWSQSPESSASGHHSDVRSRLPDGAHVYERLRFTHVQLHQCGQAAFLGEVSFQNPTGAPLLYQRPERRGDRTEPGVLPGSPLRRDRTG